MSKVQVPTRKRAYKLLVRQKKKRKIRAKISGTNTIPRISLYRSLRHIHVQAIDDDKGETLVALSTLQKDFAQVKVTIEGGETLGVAFAKKMKEKNISRAVFDRNAYKYHGVVKSFVEAVRTQGIQI